MNRIYVFATSLMLLSAAQAASTRAGDPVDLLQPTEAWESWAPRPEIAPAMSREAGGGPNSAPVLTIAGGGNPDGCGCWRRPMPPLTAGRRYLIEAAFQCQDVSAEGHCIWAMITRGKKEFDELVYRETRDGWHRMSLELAPNEDWNDLDLRLYLAWAPRGVVRWSAVRVTDITDQPAKRRIARLAAISGKPKDPKSIADCMDFYCQRLDEVGEKSPDLVVLPEVINADQLRNDGSNPSEPIPGYSTDRLAEKARKYRTYIVASLVEEEGPRLYNTAVVLDREGKIIGKYRKTHLTVGEGLLSGKRPGDSYPVFDTDFGRIGVQICFDNHYPEVARILAVKGAEIIAFPNMSDSREGGELWEPTVRVRAVDNHVHIVAAVNFGRSCIVSPRGELLSTTGKERGGIALAECDLDQSVRNYSDRSIGKRYLQVRRADTFEPLLHHYWESKGFEARAAQGAAD